MMDGRALQRVLAGMLVVLVLVLAGGSLFHVHAAGDADHAACATCEAAQIVVLLPPVAPLADLAPAMPPSARPVLPDLLLPAGAPLDRPSARGPPRA